MTAVGKAVNAAEHRRYCPQACTPCNQEHHEDLYLTASAGGTPPRICPVIMPGKETTAVTDIELMTGISALRSASRVTGPAATCLVAPSISCASTLARRLTRLVVRALRPRPMPVMQLPKIMPSSGIA